MELGKIVFRVMVPLIGMLFLIGNCSTSQARKYYSLQEVGLSGCTTDNVDYTIVSIRGNTIKYIKYQFSEKECKWKKVKGVQTAKLTSGTKYYVGDSRKVSKSLKKKAKAADTDKKIKSDKKTNSKRAHLLQKSKNIDTEKWIYRVRKGTVKKNIPGRNNEIRIVNGKVTKLAVKLTY